MTVGDEIGIGVDGDITYRPAALAINRLDINWQGAHANANGTIGLTGRRALDLSVRADALQVSALLRAIERMNYRTYACRPRLGRLTKARLLARVWLTHKLGGI